MRQQQPTPQLRLSASVLFRSVGSTPGVVCPCPLPHPQWGKAPAAVPGTASFPSTTPAQHRSPTHKILPSASHCPSLFSHLSLAFFLFFPGPAPPLQSSRDRTQSSNSGTHIGQASFCTALWVKLLILLIN